MQFNSYIFIIVFLPAMFALYFASNKIHMLAGKVILILGSLFFYAYLDKSVLIFLIASIAVNYLFAVLIKNITNRKILIAVPIAINVAFLLYFKYCNFAIENISILMKTEYEPKNIIIPIGISFITFQQIAYVVTVYKEGLEKNDLIDYLVYILYFPKLLIGPLAEPVDFIREINDPERKTINSSHIAEGLKMFSFGLFKKMVLADTLANAVSCVWGGVNASSITSADCFLIMLFYTFEIYFDFSGYSDMAIGVSRMLNITLPINFDSPYKALSIRDFWKRWHISLTGFLTKYIYIPLGGNKKGKAFTHLNIMIVFVVSGIWHGANWTFILWGFLHGITSVFERVFEKFENKLIEPVRWGITFLWVNILWLLFSADSVQQWLMLLGKMFSFQDISVSDGLINVFLINEAKAINYIFHLRNLNETVRGLWMLIFIAVSYGICLIPENNYKSIKKISAVTMIMAAVACVWGILCLGSASEFVYFDF